MKVKCFAIDVDGTMTEDGGKLHLEAVNATRWLENQGYNVIFVSGRSAQETFSLAVYAGTTRVVVGENGGVLQSSPNKVTLIGDKTYPLLAYDYLSSRMDGVNLMDVNPRVTEVVLERSFDIEKGKEILEESKLPVGLVDSKYSFHITEKGLDKAKGLRVALQLLKLNPSDCVAIGDSETDVPLFRMCGYSIAVGNASDEVKAEASFSTPIEMGRGTVRAIEHVTEKFLKIGLEDLHR